MIDSASQLPKQQRTIEVDMSSEAIASRLRDVGELNELGLSLTSAKPCLSPVKTERTETKNSDHCKTSADSRVD